MTVVPSPDELTADDVAWAHSLAEAMITSALEMARLGSDPSVKPVYAAVRSHALSVRTDDGLGAERWFVAMYLLAARTAALLGTLAARDGVTADELWRSVIQSRLAE